MRYLFRTYNSETTDISYSDGFVTCPCVLVDSASDLKPNSTIMVSFRLRPCTIVIEGEHLESTMDFKEFTNFIACRNILFTASANSLGDTIVVATDVILEDSIPK